MALPPDSATFSTTGAHWPSLCPLLAYTLTYNGAVFVSRSTTHTCATLSSASADQARWAAVVFLSPFDEPCSLATGMQCSIYIPRIKTRPNICASTSAHQNRHITINDKQTMKIRTSYAQIERMGLINYRNFAGGVIQSAGTDLSTGIRLYSAN